MDGAFHPGSKFLSAMPEPHRQISQPDVGDRVLRGPVFVPRNSSSLSEILRAGRGRIQLRGLDKFT